MISSTLVSGINAHFHGFSDKVLKSRSDFEVFMSSVGGDSTIISPHVSKILFSYAQGTGLLDEVDLEVKGKQLTEAKEYCNKISERFVEHLKTTGLLS